MTLDLQAIIVRVAEDGPGHRPGVCYEDRSDLLAEVERLRNANAALHRRAQRLEGVDARLSRVRSGYEQLVSHLHARIHKQKRGTRCYVHLIEKALNEANVPDTGVYRRPAERVSDLSAQRDRLLAAVARLTAAARSLTTYDVTHGGDCPHRNCPSDECDGSEQDGCEAGGAKCDCMVAELDALRVLLRRTK